VQLLLAWCQDVADAAGGMLGLKSARTDAERDALKTIAARSRCTVPASGTPSQAAENALVVAGRTVRPRFAPARGVGHPPRDMPLSFLEFEQPIAELEAKIDELRFVSSDAEVNVGEEIARLRAESRALTSSIFANLTPWQVAQLARHPQRP